MIETRVGRKSAYTETLPRTPGSARVARRLASSALRFWGLDELEDAVQLVIAD